MTFVRTGQHLARGLVKNVHSGLRKMSHSVNGLARLSHNTHKQYREYKHKLHAAVPGSQSFTKFLERTPAARMVDGLRHDVNDALSFTQDGIDAAHAVVGKGESSLKRNFDDFTGVGRTARSDLVDGLKNVDEGIGSLASALKGAPKKSRFLSATMQAQLNNPQLKQFMNT